MHRPGPQKTVPMALEPDSGLKMSEGDSRGRILLALGQNDAFTQEMNDIRTTNSMPRGIEDPEKPAASKRESEGQVRA